ncbi:MAG TPA: hypothetical protein VMU34_24275, partial [Mycobacterium sp.]|nr:hypothetical protein [Mycobacterium sp.]
MTRPDVAGGPASDPDVAAPPQENITVQSGLETTKFASRRDLVLRRFRKNKPAVVALVLLVVMFVGCYALPPFLPYHYTDLDF